MPSNNDTVFAEPRTGLQFADCLFYHTMGIPGVGLAIGDWDLRAGVDAYLGGLDLRGKLVLEIGPASGFLTFEMEKRGAAVTAIEVKDNPGWDFVPYPPQVLEPLFGPRHEIMRRLKNSWWFNHAAFASKAKLAYADAYALPDALGAFDVAIVGALLLHTRAPLQILEQCATRAETIIVTDLLYPDLEGSPVCRLHPTAANGHWDTWWEFSSDFVRQFLGVMGFVTELTTHSQPYCGHPRSMFTVVGRRISVALERPSTARRSVLGSTIGASVLNSKEELVRRVNSLPWFHQIDLGNGIVTPGRTSIGDLRAVADVFFGASLSGKSVLDIGCYDGFFSFEAMRRGADRVLATDYFMWKHDPRVREAFEIARNLVAPGLEDKMIDISDLSPQTVGTFDVVLFSGVFYHLRHPFLVLERIAALATETLIVETHLDAMDIERPAMVMYPGTELNNDPTNWWGPNPACVTAMLRDVGFARVDFQPNPNHPANRGIFHGRR